MTGNPRTVAVVQARMGSSRLPGKMLACLGGRPVIEHVLRRSRRAETLDTVVLATSNKDQDDALGEVAVRLSVPVVRGSETDVLRRVVTAATEHDADVVVRICADNPLIAPGEIDRAVRHHDRTSADYVFNHVTTNENRYPGGFGCEVLNLRVLETIAEKATTTAHHEHVTAYIWDNKAEFSVESVLAPESLAGVEAELDLDTAADYAMLRALFEHAPADVTDWSPAAILNSYRKIES